MIGAEESQRADVLQFDRPLDLERMRRERHRRLIEQMRAQDVDVLLLASPSNVVYATGAVVPAADAARAAHRRAVTIVTADGAPPALYMPNADGVPAEFPREQLCGPLDLEWDDDARELVSALPGGRLAVDDLTMPLWAALNGREVIDSGGVVASAKVIKTADEIECIRRAQAINEAAIADVETMARPGIKATDLSGRFLRKIFELGASSNTVDPIWQVMERDPADRPFSMTGDLVFPTPTTPRELAQDDLVWVDNGINYCGYQSDYGNAWIIGREPNAREREHYTAWRAVLDRVLGAMRPGASCADLTTAAGEVFGRRPWLPHLYIGHGTGTDSAELPYVGTDLGAEFDASFLLAPGMVLVLEPITWEDGGGGYRAEEIVAVTADGYELLSHVGPGAWN